LRQRVGRVAIEDHGRHKCSRERRGHPEQAWRAAKLRRDAEIIAVTVPALREFAWVLIRGYRRAAGEVISMVRSLLESAAVRVDRPAIEASSSLQK
jgi:hypothetical protein